MGKDSEIKHKIVQTYAEDIVNVIENNKEGLIKKIIHGEEEHEIEKRNLSPESKKNKFFMFASLILIFVALTTLFFFIFTKDNSTVPIEIQFVPIIFVDKSAFFEVKDFRKDKIAQTVLNEVNGTIVKNGGVEGIYLSSAKKVVGLREFISLIKGNFILGNIDFVKDNFLLGVVNGKTKDFFMLIKMRTLPDIFDSLRIWENKMFLDLHGFFAIDISPETNYLLTKEFQNGIVENKNARILYDKDNRILMMYIFADDSSVIITNTPSAVHEIMLRLASSQIKK